MYTLFKAVKRELKTNLVNSYKIPIVIPMISSTFTHYYLSKKCATNPFIYNHFILKDFLILIKIFKWR